MTEAVHAEMGPSGWDRWKVCPGSVPLCRGLPDNAKTYTRQGTADHTLLEWSLTNRCDAERYLGIVIPVDDEQFVVDKTMAARVTGVARSIRNYQNNPAYAQPGLLFIEQDVPIDHLTGEAGATGRADAVIMHGQIMAPDGTMGVEIQVHDYKGGFNPVDVVDNGQAQMYLLGAIKKHAGMNNVVRGILVIHQPHVSEVPSEWIVMPEQMNEFEAECKRRALQVNAACAADDVMPFLNPDPKACKYCKAMSAKACPALEEEVSRLVFTDHSKLIDPATETIGNASGTIAENAFLAVVFDRIPLIEDYLESVKAAVRTKLLAGEVVPGFGLFNGRRGNRAWKDETEAEKTLQSFRMKREEMYEYKLISPTTAEKMLKETPKRWSKLEPLITATDGVPVVDKLDSKKTPYQRVIPVFVDRRPVADAPVPHAVLSMF